MKSIYLIFFFINCVSVFADFGYKLDYEDPYEYERCYCVPKDKCRPKILSFINPRNFRYSCDYTEVCCGKENIIEYDTSYTGYVPKEVYTCGKRNQFYDKKRITSYNNFASFGEFPWQAAILKKDYSSFIFKASGVLIDDNKVVTTAHNVQNLYSEKITVRLGENNFRKKPSKKYSSVDTSVEKVFIHPKFNKDTLENDFAVLCLDEKVKYSPIISPICLPSPDEYVDETIECTVSGWGKDRINGNFSTALKKVNLNLINRSECQSLIAQRIKDKSYYLDNSLLCAGGEKSVDACKGDGGGPLSCPNKYGAEVLRGLVSWGIGCGEKNVPGIYSNVQHAVNWIKSIKCSTDY